MDLEELFWIVVPILGLFAGYVTYAVKVGEKKKAKEKNEPKGKEGKRIKQSELGFFAYLYFVFITRAALRPASRLLFFLFGFMWGGIFTYINVIDYFNPVLKLEEMQTDIGIIKKINIPYRGSRNMILLHEDGTTARYTVGWTPKERDIFFSHIGKKVKVYYQNEWETFWFDDGVYTVEADGIIIKGERFKYNYQKRLDGKRESLSDIIFWSIYNLIFLLWMFYFNYKEKPIHRLNRIRKLNGKQMAM